MPLQYDDIPGSWGVYSSDWPSLRFRTEDGANRAFIACSKGRIVPYGSYVQVDFELRVETPEMKAALKKYLDESPYRTYPELRQFYIDTGRMT